MKTPEEILKDYIDTGFLSFESNLSSGKYLNFIYPQNCLKAMRQFATQETAELREELSNIKKSEEDLRAYFDAYGNSYGELCADEFIKLMKDLNICQ